MIYNDIKVLEGYYIELSSWYTDSNCISFDVDILLTKDKLEQLIDLFYSCSNLSSLCVYIDFLTELKEDVCDRRDIIEAIDNIISEIVS